MKMIAQSRKIRIKPTIKNPLSEKLREKHQNFLFRNKVSKAVQGCKNGRQ
jgi:hypothetical protein